MIYLHQYPAAWGLPSLSPFCLKVETYLRMRDLPYQVVVERNPRRGPKGKMPFIRDEDQIVPDSRFILQYLVKRYGLGTIYPPTSSQAAVALAFERLIEEELYWVLLYSRWLDPISSKTTARDFARLFPKPLGPILLPLIRRELSRQCFQQGMGRHSAEEIYAIGEAALESLSVFLGEKAFFLGERVSATDASLYAFLETIRLAPKATPLQNALRQRQNLLNYAARIRGLYFPEAKV